MEEAIRKFRDELERRVRERTVELEVRILALEKEIARREQYEAELKASGEEILKEIDRRRFIAKSMVDLLERDRREVGRVLHDEVGQVLATIHMDLDLLKIEPQVNPVELKDRIEKIQERIKGATAYVRNISRRLIPNILDHLGLEAAIRSLMQPFENQADTQTHVFIKNIPEKLDPRKKLAVFRIVQEATTNILRYAGAKNVYVNIFGKDNVIMISVEDDGKGFKYDDVIQREGGEGNLGLAIIKERALQAGGTLRVESKVGKGTHVFGEIPVD